MDRIGDFIARIRNAGGAGLPTVVVPRTRVISAIAKVLNEEGYIGAIEEKDIKGFPHLVIEVLYRDGRPVIQGGKRISKLSGRVYTKSQDISPVRNGYGLSVLSTPEGIITGKAAQEARVGGELLFEIW